MKSRRRFESIFVALLFVALSGGLILSLSTGLVMAQDSQAAPPAPGQDQSYPDQSVQQSYPDQSAQQPSYPGQQSYPDQGQQSYPNQGQSPYPGQSGQQQQQDPPGRVARVQYMSGEVSTQPGGVNDWVAASLNRPLTSADRVWTDKNSKAELNVGDGFLRMNSETSVTLTNVSDNTIQIELDQGILEVSVRHLQKGEIYEVDTPNYAFTIMKSGVYRFDVYPNEDQSWVTVRSGYGEATGRGSAVRVNSGQQVRFSNGNTLTHTAENAPSRDGFDDWAQVRDKRLDDSLSARYVSPGVIGYQDLDTYGHWVPTPNYGNVWIPYSVPTGWAPYRFGHWAWIAPWGWTWVDDQPWGFAPFHYGRWVSWGGYWGWAPGPVGYWNPYYSPALVGWIGGSGWGVGFGFGGGGWGVGVNFGWFPLGFGEPFYPRYCGWGHGGWYRGGGFVSNTYIRNVNITNTRIVNINNVTNNYYHGNFANARYGFRNTPGAVTGAPRSAFTSGAAINRVGGAVPRRALGQGSMLRGVDATPTRESVLGGRAPQTRGVPPSSAFNRSVVTANHGPAMRPANLQTANQATAAHGNMNAMNRGPVNTPSNAARPNLGANPNTRMNGSQANMQAGSPAHGNFEAAQNGHAAAEPGNAHNQANQGVDARMNAPRMETPTSMGGHYVPRPPSAGGNPVTEARPGMNTGAMHGNANANVGRSNETAATNGANRNPAVGGTPHYGATSPSTPRPTQTYQPGHVNTPQYSVPSHQATPNYSAPKGNTPSGHGPTASAPRPPTGYTYRPAPTYSAPASNGANANRAYGASYGNNSPRSYSAPSYNAGRSTSPTPSYSAGRSASQPAYHTATPSYSSRSYGSSMPSYSSRSAGSYNAGRASMPSYSAPRSSGGGGGYHPSGGGSSFHGGGGGGGHSGGGGHGR